MWTRALQDDRRQVHDDARGAEDEVQADPQEASEPHGGQAEEEQRHVERQGVAIVSEGGITRGPQHREERHGANAVPRGGIHPLAEELHQHQDPQGHGNHVGVAGRAAGACSRTSMRMKATNPETASTL